MSRPKRVTFSSATLDRGEMGVWFASRPDRGGARVKFRGGGLAGSGRRISEIGTGLGSRKVINGYYRER